MKVVLPFKHKVSANNILCIVEHIEILWGNSIFKINLQGFGVVKKTFIM